ncbi:unnamed protein product, partial [Polarella glacialis]
AWSGGYVPQAQPMMAPFGQPTQVVAGTAGAATHWQGASASAPVLRAVAPQPGPGRISGGAYSLTVPAAKPPAVPHMAGMSPT